MDPYQQTPITPASPPAPESPMTYVAQPQQSLGGVMPPAQPQPPLPPPASQPLTPAQVLPRKSKVGVFVALAVVVLLIAAAAAVIVLKRSRKTPAVANSTGNVLQQAQSNDSQSPTSASYALTDQVKLSAAPAIVRDNLDKDWQTDTANPGLDGIVHGATGCKVYFTESQSRSKNTDSSDKVATDVVMQATVDDLSKGGTISDRQNDTVTLKIASSADTIEFERMTMTYSSGPAEFKTVTVVRSIDGYVTGMRFYCPSGSFSTELARQTFDDLAIKLSKETH